ncbi:unnamed protein product [Didymodactylos carnosus]|uniref:AAA+ ATPase domain-containing protein n=1 Tax=Didymodactylos carnosus TaxID=1234261 RepID=A0A813RIB6_9BILA|nr:unnamed protein product [Didymodactylos carnosus]CAF0781321.1 unnamed protein product [Didymodactylos carnosus]CAF3498612.1 unnamed protein product [Didymodactylos carnosus]CAF3564629.1 unnamed protein product [Didymodactylos carnosus]
MNVHFTSTNLCSQCTSFFFQSLRYLPQSVQQMCEYAFKKIPNRKIGKARHKQAFKYDHKFKSYLSTLQLNSNLFVLNDLTIDRLLSQISKEEIQSTLSLLTSVSSEKNLLSCLSCRAGLSQHLTHNDLLKIEKLVYNQVRGFKTHHSTFSGVGGENRLAGFKSFKSHTSSTIQQGQPSSSLFQRIIRLVRPSSQSENNRLNNLLQVTKNADEQQKIKVAFAEGYAAVVVDSKPKDRLSLFKVVRVILFMGIMIMILLNIISALGGGGVRGGFANAFSNKFEINPEDVNVNFTDVRGAEEAKDELRDIVAYLRDGEKFTRLGARLPKGVLLVGPPGIGKTLLARAVAGEAGVAFFHTSGSEFDEMFVGTGARRVRQLFTAAKARTPCVIFIDEIDSVGAKRTSSQLHPYANQTINQLLAEMDGFDKNEGIILLAATNRRDYLDSAILRPGRFDVEIHISPPDLRGRKDIFELYLSKVKHDHTVDTEYLAKGSTGFTGADIENMTNQAALYAAQLEEPAVNMKHMEWARDKVLMGTARKSKLPDMETNKITAYHEAGHTLVRYFTDEADPLHKVTIIPRGQALGFTAHIPDKDIYNRTRSQLLAEMDVMFGGRAAEELAFGIEKITTGASSDFNQATKLATNMVKQFGMSEKVGHRSFKEEEQDAGMGFIKVNDISPAMQETIDYEIRRLMQESYERAKSLLKQHSNELKTLAEALLHYETLDAEEVKAVLEGRKVSS